MVQQLRGRTDSKSNMESYLNQNQISEHKTQEMLPAAF
jgi:hypothetical protein